VAGIGAAGGRHCAHAIEIKVRSAEATGYDMKLDNLRIHSMVVSGDALVVDFDGDLSMK
jgi:hypothetical protein